jgi:predicted XRE-type DNA-binding protein
MATVPSTAASQRSFDDRGQAIRLTEDEICQRNALALAALLERGRTPWRANLDRPLGRRRIAVDAKKRGALEAAGWKIGDTAEFLGLNEEEQQIIEFRLLVGRGVRRLRETHQLTQRQLAARIGSSQSRVAKIEAASSEVSLDLMLRGFFSAGGRLTDLIPPTGIRGS